MWNYIKRIKTMQDDLNDIDYGAAYHMDGTNFSDFEIHALLEEKDSLVSQNRDLFMAATPETKARIVKFREENQSHNYLQICEDLYYWRKSLVDGYQEDGPRRFYSEVEEHLDKKRAWADQYLQFYRNIYQRAWNEIPDRQEVLNTILSCVVSLTDYDIRRFLAQDKNAYYWEFQDRDIVLRNCTGTGMSIREITTLDELKQSMQPSQNDPVEIPDEETEDEETGIDYLFGAGASESREAHFVWDRDGTRVTTHFKMVNCNIVEANGKDSVPVIIDGALLASYVRYDSAHHNEGIIEEHRSAFVFDYRHRHWAEISLKEYRLL
jgi:Fe-S cluster biosynthesis and repair protein YggX